MIQPILILIAAIAATYFGARLARSKKKLKEQSSAIAHLQEEKKLVFDFLHDVGEAFAEDVDRRQLLETIAESAVRVTTAASGVIYLKDEQTGNLHAEAICGNFPPLFKLPRETQSKIVTRKEYLETVLRNEPVAPEESHPLGSVIVTGDPIWIRDAQWDDRFPKVEEKALKVHSFLAVPLHYHKERLGVLALANHGSGLPFSEQDFEIAKSIADMAAFSLYNARIYTQLAEKQRMDRDLQTARDIQEILLPKRCPSIEHFDLAAVNIPAQSVSGDYYDFFPINEHLTGIAIGDVSGKGVPASLIMAMCRSVMHTQAPGKNSAAEVLREVNRILFPDIREDMFITMLYMILDTKENTVTIAKAGHDAPLLLKENHTTVETLKSPGMALGIDSGEVFDIIIQDLVIPLAPQDTLLVYTDGINEAVDSLGQEFGRDAIKTALKSSSNQGAEFLIENIVERVTRFRGDEVQNDDITLVALQRK